MDENLLIMSFDIVNFIVRNVGGLNESSQENLLAFDGDHTFAINFAFWTHFLNLTIFDDRARIDSQQHYLTRYMVIAFDNMPSILMLILFSMNRLTSKCMLIFRTVNSVKTTFTRIMSIRQSWMWYSIKQTMKGYDENICAMMFHQR